jgi:hypothetical protein
MLRRLHRAPRNRAIQVRLSIPMKSKKQNIGHLDFCLHGKSRRQSALGTPIVFIARHAKHSRRGWGSRGRFRSYHDKPWLLCGFAAVLLARVRGKLKVVRGKLIGYHQRP